MRWIIGAVAVGLVLVIAVVLVAPGGGDAAGEDPVAVDAELTLIEQQAEAALDNRRDLAPLIADLRRFAEQHPDEPRAHRLLGLLLSQSDATGAYAHLQKAAKLSSEPDAEVLGLLGSLALKVEGPAVARDYYERAVELAPTNARLGLQLAYVAIEAGEPDAAAAHLDRVIQLDASQHKAYAMLAGIAADAGDLPRALDLIGKAVQRVPAREVPTRTMYARRQAEYWQRHGDPAQALAVLRLLPIEAQFLPDVATQMAELWSAMDEPAKAARHYEQAATLYPALVDAPSRSAEWYDRAGMPEDARRMRAMGRRRGE